uniref:UspA domain-containing protein n=2 Tax=Lotharella globosa TaxID=91324 RepID=A0A7S3YB75_9EUKA|mmetsp:Transcript_781/g.1526  ORF Transcript_781/g.1526 Transcript_781/m.1526 type:complete len:163 (+) Transcript_781:88-576(+)
MADADKKENKLQSPAKEDRCTKTHVMICIDASEHSTRVVEWTAKHLRADKVTMVHVYNYQMVHPSLTDVDRARREHAIQVGKDLLNQLSHKASVAGMKVDELKLLAPDEGAAKYIILKYVQKVRPTVLVCGTRGMGAVSRAFLGSVSDYLTHNCPCTVTVVN